MYSVAGYSQMIADRVRVEAYLQALQRVMRPGAVVVEIGTGTGMFALLACRYGARRVYAIEPDDAIQVARELAAANGLADRIEFIQDLSRRVALPEQADVILSDLRGVLPLFGQHIPSIVDARQRLRAPGGVLIPQCDTLWAALVQAPELFREHTEPWGGDGSGFDLRPVQRIVTNTWRKARLKPEQLLVEPQCWATLDYSVIEQADVRGEASWTAARPGTAHGLNIWFDAELAEGIGFSNAPSAPSLIYGSAFLPLPEPVAIDPGDTISVTLQADLVGEDYVWSWETDIREGEPPRPSKAAFRQSTFFGSPLSAGALRKRASGYKPSLNEDGAIDACILALMSGGNGTSLGSIAHHVRERFPHRFRRWEDALTRVSDLADRYSR